MKADTLELDIHTTVKQIKEIADTKDILRALQTVIDVPSGCIDLELRLSANEAPQITFTKLAEKVSE